MHSSLTHFIQMSREIVLEKPTPPECTERIAPLMHELLSGDKDFLKPEHFRSNDEQYTRNAIHIDDDQVVSLYAMVWQPNQWTPIHDHGTWGVVGIYEGALEERSFVRTDEEEDLALDDIHLDKSSVVILAPNSIASFVPDPDHIHITGNPTNKRTVSLHLYGSSMTGFYVYDKEACCRKWTDVTHNKD